MNTHTYTQVQVSVSEDGVTLQQLRLNQLRVTIRWWVSVCLCVCVGVCETLAIRQLLPLALVSSALCVRRARSVAISVAMCACSLRVCVPTPANQHVDSEAAAAGVSEQQQGVQVEALHQQPEEVGHDEVVEENEAHLAAHLHTQTRTHIVVRDWERWVGMASAGQGGGGILTSDGCELQSSCSLLEKSSASLASTAAARSTKDTNRLRWM